MGRTLLGRVLGRGSKKELSKRLWCREAPGAHFRIFCHLKSLGPKGPKGPIQGAHQGGHATTRFLEGFLEGSLEVSASEKGSLKAPLKASVKTRFLKGS